MFISSTLFPLLLSTVPLCLGAVLAPRAPGLFADLPVTDQAEGRNTDYCQTPAESKFRSARDTVFSPVAQGRSAGGTFDDVGYSTSGLVTCFAAAVTGTDPDGLKYKVLGHFQASRMMADSEWDTFSTLVKGRSLTGMKGFVSYPNVDSTPPAQSDDTPRAWSQEDKDYSSIFFDLLNQKVLDLTGTSCLITERDMDPPATSSIETVVDGDGKKTFLFKSNDQEFTSE